jgi:UDP-GlcNAc:undecaprenyl-phosphate/decaprenyl-phosphate GlcNAc-1-phosphate transferase
LAVGFGLVDRPCSRKQHSGEIPLVGGLAIYAAIFISSFLFVQFDANYKLYLISTSFMVLIGALDDFYDLDAGLRLIAQFLIGSLMVFGADMYISNLGNLFGMGDVELGFFGPIFTLLAVVTAINAFNMMDGVDGLVGSLSINTFIAIGFLAYFSGSSLNTDLPAMFFGAIFAFLFFNFGRFKGGKYKVFMGDAGSMLVGLTIIWLVTYSSQGTGSLMHPITAVWLIAIPLMDMFSVMLRRILAGRSPLIASRDHIHHVFLFHGFSNTKTTLIIASLSVLFCVVGILSEFEGIDEDIMAAAFIVLFVIYNHAMIMQDKRMNT